MPQSSAGAPEIKLTNSPKMLLPLRHAWCPEGFIVTFKLETDESILVRKAQGSIEKYGMNLVIANLLTTRKEEVTFITAEGSAAQRSGVRRPRVKGGCKTRTEKSTRVLFRFSSHFV